MLEFFALSDEKSSGQLTNLEQRALVKAEFFRGKKVSEIHDELVEPNDGGTVHHSTVPKWYSMYKEGRMSTADAPRSDKPVSRNSSADFSNQMVLSMVLDEDRRMMVREITA